MAHIAPFRGLRFNPEQYRSLRKIITPPYDVISPAEQDRFYLSHQHNVIRLVLAKEAPEDGNGGSRYARARETYRRLWREDVLVRDDRPAIYIYQITYSLRNNGREDRATRTGFICLLRLEDFASGQVKPHERTFSAIKADRLKLITHCRANFCQVFTLYDDGRDDVLAVLKAAAPANPEIEFEDRSGTLHALWPVTDPEAHRQAALILRQSSFYVADGHHRYETCLTYRDLMRRRYPEAPARAPFNYTPVYALSMQDPGLTILPTHRLITHLDGFDLEDFLRRAGQCFEVRESPLGPAADLALDLAAQGREQTALGLYCGQQPDRVRILKLRDGVMDQLDLHPALKDLDVVVLNQVVYDRLLGLSQEECDDHQRFVYDPDMASALERVQSGEFELVFLINPTRIEQMKAVADAGLIMPHKSTFFYPKVSSGLVINPIIPSEVVADPLAD